MYVQQGKVCVCVIVWRVNGATLAGTGLCSAAMCVGFVIELNEHKNPTDRIRTKIRLTPSACTLTAPASNHMCAAGDCCISVMPGALREFRWSLRPRSPTHREPTASHFLLGGWLDGRMGGGTPFFFPRRISTGITWANLHLSQSDHPGAPTSAFHR